MQLNRTVVGITKMALSTKQTDTTEWFTFDFTNMMIPGESLSSITSVVNTQVSGDTDETPSAMLSGSASISGKTVLQLVTGGLNECVYMMVVTVSTSASNTLVLTAYLPVAT